MDGSYLDGDPAGPAQGGASGGEEGAEQLLERYRNWMQTVADSAPVAVMAVDAEGRIIFWNRAAEEIFGWSAGEALGRPNPIVPEGGREQFESALVAALAGRPQRAVELERRRKDGSPAWIRLTNAPILEPGGEPTGVIAVAEDITDAVHVRRRLARLQRALRARAALAGAIASSEDEEALYRAACRAAVEEAGYRLAWVGIADDDERRVRPAAQAGFEEGYLESVRITWDDSETGQGPAGAAIRTGTPAVANDIEHDPRFAPWREEALRRGYRSSAALPLLVDGRPVGALNLYAAEPDGFGEEELELLSGLVSDLSLAVLAVRSRSGRLQAEREAREHERHLDHVLRSSPAVLYTLRAGDFTPTWVSGNVTEVLGYTAEEALQPGWWQGHVHPADLDRALKTVADLAETGAVAHEYRFFTADGSEIWVRDVLRLIFGKHGEPREIIGALVDITGRQRAEEALRESEERYRLAFQTSPDSININRLEDGLYVDVNEGFTWITGYTREDVLGRTSLELNIWVDPEDRQRLVAGLRERGVVRNLEAAFRMKDGSLRTGLMSAAVLPLAGEPHILSITRDITELVRAREELERSASRLEILHSIDGAILEAWSAGEICESALDRVVRLVPAERASIAVFDEAAGEAVVYARGTLTDELGATRRLDLGETFPEIERLRASELVRVDDLATAGELDAGLARLREAGILSVLNIPLLAHGALLGSLNFGFGRPRGFSGRHIEIAREVADSIAIAVEQARLRETLERHAAELESRVAERTAELEAFAYSVSHDLRAPLRAIDGFGEALAEELEDVLDERKKDYLDRMRAAARRMGAMIDELLALSRASRVEVERTEVNLSALASEVVAELREGEPHRTVEVSVAEGLTARGDRRLLRLVLQNLIGNAWKFTGPVKGARIELGSLPGEGGEAVFFVRDNGVGFDMKYADKLFGAFQRLYRREEFPGEGVGLATVQRIVARHGGRVWAEAEPGAGATFFFTLKGGSGP